MENTDLKDIQSLKNRSNQSNSEHVNNQKTQNPRNNNIENTNISANKNYEKPSEINKNAFGTQETKNDSRKQSNTSETKENNAKVNISEVKQENESLCDKLFNIVFKYSTLITIVLSCILIIWILASPGV